MLNERWRRWFPTAVYAYALHTEFGHSMEQVAQIMGRLHRSTILRWVVAIEDARDDGPDAWCVEAAIAAAIQEIRKNA